jgi:hypothetical protein
MVKAKEDDIRHLSDLKQKVHEARFLRGGPSFSGHGYPLGIDTAWR